MNVTWVPPAAVPASGERLTTLGALVYVYPKSTFANPDGVVTWTSTEPGAPPGVMAWMMSSASTLVPMAGTPPISSTAPPEKPVPLTSMGVPPSIGPFGGSTSRISMGLTNSNPCSRVVTVPSPRVTRTVTRPGECGGVITRSAPLSWTNVSVPAVVPNSTVAPGVNPCPIKVTISPPPVLPVEGTTVVIRRS